MRFWYYDHHLWHRHHRHHHNRDHHHLPRPKCTHICPRSMGTKQQIPLENLSWISALPKMQLSTFPAESKAAIVDTLAWRYREILSRWPCNTSGSDNDIDHSKYFGRPPPATRPLQHAIGHLPYASWCMASASQQVSGSSMQGHISRHRVFHGKLLADGILWVCGSFG